MPATDDHLLSVYLHDHLAGAAGGLELARRAAKEQAATEVGPELAQLAADIEQDRDSLRSVLADLGMNDHHPHEAITWLAEKAARLKPNGQVIGRSPLTALIELETLRIALIGKLSGWLSLRLLADDDPRLNAAELDTLIDRGSQQAETAERLRLVVAATALRTPKAN
ncbi:hypothetical protein acdb102_20460 [Acidothermaceae bacterium B102]|nr:hypothetical protein acdb102_20460 [Acidothermaceae bacterium B102]